MPNNCRNIITIVGHKEDLQEINANKLSFEYFCPPPDTLTEKEQYNWRINNWGTKWDAYDMEIIEETSDMGDEYTRDHIFEATFTTAWDPPIPFVESLLKLFPRCWMKLTWKTEDNQAGVFVQYYKNRDPTKSVATYAKWFEAEPRLTTSGEILVPDDS
jgi:hypothetical protein